MTVERRRIFYSYVDHFSLLWQNNQFLPIVLGIGRIPNSKSLDTSLVLMETPHYIIIAKNLHSSNICRKFRELRMHYDRDRFSKRERVSLVQIIFKQNITNQYYSCFVFSMINFCTRLFSQSTT